jgi:hypothetical protein
MAALVATSMGVVREVLGDSVVDEVDEPIVDYIANVLADQDFDFGPPDGHGIFDALGELLIDARCVYDREHCLEVLLGNARPPPSNLIAIPIPQFGLELQFGGAGLGSDSGGCGLCVLLLVLLFVQVLC